MRKPTYLLPLAFSTVALGCSEGYPSSASSPRDESRDATSQAVDDISESDAATDDEAELDDLDPGLAAPAPPADVDVAITSDNAFSFGYGDADSVKTFVEGVASGAGEIFDCPVDYGPEPYVVPGADAPDGAYLYIIAWADRAYSQGALAQFKRVGGEPIYSGDGAWEVCATGKEYNPLEGPGPDQATVNGYLAACNAGNQGDTFSHGWVDLDGPVTPGARGKLAFGERNDDPEEVFPVVCQRDDAGVSGIDPEARWMWFDPEDGDSPFLDNTANRTQAFLIFRLPADVLVLF